MTSESKSEKEVKREFEALDFTRLHFPSDQLSVLKLRRLHPEQFDHGFRGGEGAQPRYFLDHTPAEDGIGNLLFVERLIATGAFAAARGLPSPKGWDLEEYRKKLADELCFYGLASGAHEASEMIRDIERQATQLSSEIGR